ncbi:hypothetical protein LKO27_11670 [Tessaracoccus sp. OS52]|uniref:hypothetical protein n=1 Tax=Tessaracoccus sp. OS52 TaxID=2886691 RepID=UPI001D0FAEC8|nr:hypothetical protein [Tessaracoccus sp. OS52]MCC2594064.1 hypothetical protein [Tessaracoccus sp. OS52]
MTGLAVDDVRGGRGPVITTGPAGLLLGRGSAGPVTVRLFRPRPTRVFLAAPEYVKWLLAFRAMCLGAHVSVLTKEQPSWLPLAEVIRACGGTVDILHAVDNVPGQGRPYRPSLVVDEIGAMTPQTPVGAWQAVVSTHDPTAARAVNDMRNSEISLVAPVEGKTADHLRRAYALSPTQMKLAANLEGSDVVLASVRRLVRVPMPPSPTEYRMLFGG